MTDGTNGISHKAYGAKVECCTDIDSAKDLVYSSNSAQTTLHF